MWELRWILAGLGVFIVAGVYLWGRFKGERGQVPPTDAGHARAEPSISDTDVAVSADSGEAADVTADAGAEADTGNLEQAPEPEPELEFDDSPPPEQRIEKVITLRLIPKGQELDAERAVSSLQEAGLRHGRYGIFHQDGSAFSVASLVEPGSFDLTRLEDTTLPGMSFFMLLPGNGDPVARFDAMVQTARVIAVELNSELFDDQGSSWSIQRERYVREELIAYRHRHDIH